MITGRDLSSEWLDQQFIDQSFAKMPASWSRHIGKQYTKKLKSEGRTKANLMLLDTVEAVQGFRIAVASDDHELRAFAQARADECFRVASRYVDKDQALNAMIDVAQRYEIKPPNGRNVTKTGQRMRLLDADWWRRNVRKTAARNVEASAINLGMVSRVAGLYASDEAVKRRSGQRKRNAEILASVTAANDKGQEFNLLDLANLGVSNPAIRRMELMTRVNGFDQVAIKLNHAAEFFTWTAPSKYHARHHITGRENPKYNGATPAQTQAYFCKVWARVRAKLHRDGIHIYGFRVAEPHHDGTPHWHMIIFCDQGQVKQLKQIMKRYAMKEDGEEAGADIHRFKSEAIDRKRGSAAGYLAKYISKNIDGHNVGEDWEAVAGNDSAADTAKRVDAWAATWGIRQFQQIGGQPVTVWRELRRADIAAIQHDDLKAIAEAADAAAWDRYTLLNGGIRRGGVVKLEKLPAVDVITGEMRLNKYTEIAQPKTIGVHGFGEVIHTRLNTWTFKRVAKAAAIDMDKVLKRSGAAVTPRSSVNNCTQDLSASVIYDPNDDFFAFDPDGIGFDFPPDQFAPVNFDELNDFLNQQGVSHEYH